MNILELSRIFNLSKKSTMRLLRNLGVPLATKPRFKSTIVVQNLQQVDQLYESILLTRAGRCPKPIFTITDLQQMFNLTHSGMRRYAIRHHFPLVKCGNKLIVFSSALLKSGTK